MNDESEQSLDDLTGPEIIRDFVKRLPGKPGVYRMFNAEGDAIYVGKARNLRNRVSNYARGQGHNNRIALMISLTTNMEFVTTATEAEALLLEANLIKKLKPRFNVILRDDKSFPYILISSSTMSCFDAGSQRSASATSFVAGPRTGSANWRGAGSR